MLLIFFLAPLTLATIVTGALVAIKGRKSSPRIYIGIGIASLPFITFISLAIISPGVDEWNPTIKHDSDIIGSWRGDQQKIRLHRDFSFGAQLEGKSLTGTWSRDDWNLYLTDNSGSLHTMRFIEDSNELLLLPYPPCTECSETGSVTRKAPSNK